MFQAIDSITNKSSLRLGIYVLGPVLFICSMFIMWMQVIEFTTKHEYWRILSFGTDYIFTLVALAFTRKCYDRLKVVQSLG